MSMIERELTFFLKINGWLYWPLRSARNCLISWITFSPVSYMRPHFNLNSFSSCRGNLYVSLLSIMHFASWEATSYLIIFSNIWMNSYLALNTSFERSSILIVFSTVISRYYFWNRVTKESNPCSINNSLSVSRALAWYGANLSVMLNSLNRLLIIWRTTSTSASTKTRFSMPRFHTSLLLSTAMQSGV